MTIKTVSLLAALALLVVSTSLWAQQAPYQPPTYPAQAPPSYQPPPGYQQPQYQQPQQPSYQQPQYQQPQYQQPQQPQYQQPQQPQYQQPQQPQYQQQKAPTYSQPTQPYGQPQGYAQPPGYGQQYAQPGQAYPSPQNYPGAYPAAGAAAGAAVATQGQQHLSPQVQGAPPQNELYPTHADTRFGHDHVYPNRGVVVREVPREAVVINYAGISYRYSEGVWYEPRGTAYMVVAPPIGLLVPAVPVYSTPVDSMGSTFYYANNAFYRQRPDLAGYEVVNDPSEAMPLTGPSAAGSTPSGAPLVTAAATMGAAAAAAPQTHGSTFAIFPKNGQTPDEQARDNYACYQFAVSQTGFDPARPPPGLQPGQTYAAQSTFQRAQAACYEGRGYAVRQ